MKPMDKNPCLDIEIPKRKFDSLFVCMNCFSIDYPPCCEDENFEKHYVMENSCADICFVCPDNGRLFTQPNSFTKVEE